MATQAEVMKFKLERTACRIEGMKRQNFPYKLKWTCSACGAEHERDYGVRYLSYPILPGEETDTLWCPKCDNEEEIKIKLDLTMEILSQGGAA